MRFDPSLVRKKLFGERARIRTITPTPVSGNVTAPASKSMTQRAIAAAFLTKGITAIYNQSVCDDSETALKMVDRLGSEVIQYKDHVKIAAGLIALTKTVNCGESGLAMRMFAPITALRTGQYTFNGKGSLLRRPVDMIGEALVQLGVSFQSTEGYLPLKFEGPMHGGKAVIDGSVSSQLLSGLLMALPCCAEDSEITVHGLTSKPYVDMTLEILKDFGIHVENEGYTVFRIRGGQEFIPQVYTVEGDWSGSAFLLVAGAIHGNLKVKGLRAKSLQADKAVLEALQLAGASMVIEDNTVSISSSSLRAFHFDARECPDLFPPLATLAAYCTGTSIIKGAERLIHKESNRAVTIQDVMGRLGISVEISGDEMRITGGTVRGAKIHPHNDHRIAMMATIAALRATSAVKIENPDCVNKSYPDFFDDLKRLGVWVK